MHKDPFRIRHKNINKMPNTRQDYIKRIPIGKLDQMKFTYGDINKKFNYELNLISENEKYLSVNSLDATRVALNHLLLNNDFFMKILVYPHVIVKSHGLMGIAKAERLCKGMRQSGSAKPIGIVAQVHKNQPIIVLRVNDLNLGRKVLEVASKKLKPSWKIVQVKSA